MFDVRSEAHEFVAESRAAAVSQAVEFFGVEESELSVHEPEAGEIYGLGGRVVIVAVPPGRGAPGRRSGRGEEREERGRDRGDRRESREGRERGGRGRGRERGRDRDRDRDRDESRSPREEARAAREEERAFLPSKGNAQGELGEIAQYVLGAVERMGLGSFEVSETREGDFLVVEIRGEAAPRLHEGDGRAVDALQLLANQFAMRRDDDAPRVVVDAEGDPGDREESLERLARRAAKRALESKRSIALDPMSARDRRMVHVALRDEDRVATMSVGEGRYRQVVVVPEGAPDYDEARRGAEEAAQRDS